MTSISRFCCTYLIDADHKGQAAAEDNGWQQLGQEHSAELDDEEAEGTKEGEEEEKPLFDEEDEEDLTEEDLDLNKDQENALKNFVDHAQI